MRNNEQILRIVVAYLFVCVCAMLGRPMCVGTCGGPTIGGPHGAHRDPPSRAVKRFMKPLTGEVKNETMGLFRNHNL